MRVAVVSPFVDRQHGTERAVAELLTQLTRRHACEVWLYAQRVDEAILAALAASSSLQTDGRLVWRRVPTLPGPHLLQFVAWFFLNGFLRAWDVHVRRQRFDLVFSAGINCLDADMILVHAVFRRLAEMEKEQSKSGLVPSSRLRRFHRRIYYQLLQFLEKRIYSKAEISLATVSRRTAAQLEEYFGRRDVPVAWNGVDTNVFHPAAREAWRAEARVEMRFAEGDCVFLLIGNDWRNKGLPALLEAGARCRELPIRLLVVGEDDPAPYRVMARRLEIADRVVFKRGAPNVLDFFAASDVYMAPSLEDSFNLPALEAMACGLPVAVSTQAGLSGALRDGEDAIVLHEPENVAEIAAIMRRLVNEPAEGNRLGAAAARTAQSLSWERHTEQIYGLMQECVTRRRAQQSDAGGS